MASNIDFVQYVADQCAGAGDIVVKKMFGDYGIYCNRKIFGLICDDALYIKPTEAGRLVLRTEEMRPPYPGAKDYFYIVDVDDREFLSALVRTTCKYNPQNEMLGYLETKRSKPKTKRTPWGTPLFS